mmetsp:Transcript_15259/g.43240  ORF Transcript_15259/g.43240 Transcript_15259/m.43240 type:complete len:350 (+) Transcript_15259:105-1154(+)
MFPLLPMYLGYPRAGSCCCVAAFASALALCGCYRFRNCRCRDFPCVKRILRWCGCDRFDDFSIVVVVHEALYSLAGSKNVMAIRLAAGRHKVSTDESNNGRFHQPLELFVEQGASDILVELVDARRKTTVASLKLDIMKDVLAPTEGYATVREREYAMKPKAKGIVNPRVRLTIRRDMLGAEEEGLLAGLGVSSPESTLMLREQLHKVAQQADTKRAAEPQQLSELELLVRGVAGPLEAFGKWGRVDTVYVAARGPPAHKKFTLGIWSDQRAHDAAKPMLDELEILRIESVVADPSRDDVFLLSYIQPDKVRKRMTFRRVDRSRDVWVDMLSLLIRKIREEREARKHKG